MRGEGGGSSGQAAYTLAIRSLDVYLAEISFCTQCTQLALRKDAESWSLDSERLGEPECFQGVAKSTSLAAGFVPPVAVI